MSGSGGVAVVGLACRYPDADSPARLWETVLGRRRGFRRLPATRLSSDYIGAADDPDRTYLTHAGLLRGWSFDRQRFGVPGPLHRAVDHAHWLALETAADALVDAGFPDGRGLDRDRVGVLLGNTMTGEFSRAAQLRLRWPFLRRAAKAALDGAGVDSEQGRRALALLGDLVRAPFPVPGDESLAGALSNTIAGRVCNHFDFHGTGFTVDGACASSLLSVMTAGRALLGGELDFALAGGVDLSLDPFELVGFARTGALAVDEMRVYDRRPTGFLPGEGCGVVALMRAEDAEREGVRTYAVLAGWGTSSDGAGGLTRPKADGQSLAMSRAYRMAGIAPHAVELVEGHGTGTRVGDEVELTALCQARGEGAARAALGSIKANIGHTKAAAGVAGLIKAVLAVHHRVLPPTTGVEEPHELLRAHGTPLRLLEEPEPWTTATPLASVSSMGFGGINAHVVLRGTTARPAAPVPLPRAVPPPRYDIVLLDAADRAVLEDRLDRLARLAPALSDAELHDLAATAHAERREPGAVRCALVADTADRLADAAGAARAALSTWDGELLVDEAAGAVLAAGPPRRVGLLLPGQAAPVRARLDPWADGLGVPEAGVAVVDGETDTAVAQPAVVRQSLAALAWLTASGCRAVGAVGHSLGELTALVWAGALDPATAQSLAVARGRAMADHGTPGTTMAGVAGDEDTTRALAEGLDLEITGFNGPSQTTVGGHADQVAELVRRARDRGVSATALPVSHAFHSTAMSAAAQPLREALAGVAFQPPARPVFSTVLGRPLTSDTDLVGLLTDQLTLPVRFTEALTRLAERCDLLVEAGPGTTLTSLARSTGATALSLDSGNPRRHALTTAVLAACSAADLGAWFAGRTHRPLGLDTGIDLLANPCETDLPGVDADDVVEVPAPRTEAVPQESDPLSMVRAELSRVLELPQAVVRPESTLLGDLHLNSLQVVQVVGMIAGALGRRTPDSALFGMDVTVGEVAAMLEGLPAAGPAADGPPPALERWVRAFEHSWEPFDPAADAAHPTAAAPGTWQVDAPPGHWLHDAGPLPGTPGERNLAVWLEDPRPEEVARVLVAIAGLRPHRLLVAHRGHPAAAAVGRSALVELDGCAVTVVHVREDALDPRLVAASGYRELRVRPDGGADHVTTRVRRHDRGGDLPLGPGDVCLVTGGAAGITAECGAALARRTGCTLVVLGRSEPDSVADALRALGEDVTVRYVRADVTDAAQVADAVAEAGGFGPVVGLLHGAGVNRPRLLGAITADGLRETLAPKVTGLRLLLDAAPALRLVVGFGSIIGRTGLAGQSEYCVANDWLREEVEAAAEAHPGRRHHLVEWSLWDGVGMGERMGVVEGLTAAGITPITPQDGPPALLDVLTDPGAPVTLLVTGRFPETPAVAVAGPPPQSLRFTEDPRVRYAGVEAVLDAELSLGDDPYLDEHRVQDVPVLPAVFGLEAMAQAVAVVSGERQAWEFRDVDLRSPVTVPDRGTRSVRVLALDDGAGAVRVAVRDDGDGYTADRFTAVVREAADVPEAGEADGLDGCAPARADRLTAAPAAAAPTVAAPTAAAPTAAAPTAAAPTAAAPTAAAPTAAAPTAAAPTAAAPTAAAARTVAAPTAALPAAAARTVAAPTAAQPAAAAPTAPAPTVPLPTAAPHTAASAHPFYGPLLFHRGRFRRLLAYERLSAFEVSATVRADPGTQWFSDFHHQRLLLGDPGAHDAVLHVLLACVPHRRALPVGATRYTAWRRPEGELHVHAVEREHTADDYVFDVDVRDSAGVVARWDGLRLRAIGPNRWDEALPASLVGPVLSRRLIELDLAQRVELVVASADHDTHGWVAAEAHDHVLLARAPHAVGVAWGATTPLEPDNAIAVSLAGKLDEPVEVAAGRVAAARAALGRAGLDQHAPLEIAEVTDDGLVVLRGQAVVAVVARPAVAGLGDPVLAVAVEVA
ncbi:type I polyketide synthase [Lentzea sp. NBRC 102530]|uniref:type I polyketide synthase n=1 Tax=Lentzea sp. NBRC 102530 TaxID=3032201 RepID=UPI0024A11B94|nr:type I polyketide synthase [Lentzea sp. NBRC 102530]GLY50279.1 polyketide synthase [Lentzea sp. NBRC 102530]